MGKKEDFLVKLQDVTLRKCKVCDISLLWNEENTEFVHINNNRRGCDALSLMKAQKQHIPNVAFLDSFGPVGKFSTCTICGNFTIRIRDISSGKKWMHVQKDRL